MRRIICQPKGGLGNQLFIFAMAKSLAWDNNSNLYIDTHSGFWRDVYKRKYFLNRVGVKEKKLSIFFSLIIKFTILYPKIGEFFFGIRILKETNQIEYKKLSAKSILPDGYWQNEIYFKGIKSLLNEMLRWELPNNSNIKELETKIDSKHNSVCLHGRLLRQYASDGSFVPSNDPRILPESYFQKAITLIKGKVIQPHFFIFSDNVDTFVSFLNLKESEYTPIVHSFSNSPEVDLMLMRHCSHFIISNSSYSWWAAWLGENDASVIIAPDNSYWENSKCVPTRWDTIFLN